MPPDCDADLEAKDNNGRTAILLAAKCRHKAGVKRLLDHGADPVPEDNYGWPPLLRASRDGEQSVVEVLLEYGVNFKPKIIMAKSNIDT